MKIIIVILVAILIFLGLWILKLGLKYLLNRYPRLDFVGDFLIIAESLIWLIFIFRSTSFLFREKFYYQYLVISLILIFLGFLTWFFIRDIFAGIIFRIRYNIKTGDYISSGNISGHIKSYHLTSINLLTADGLVLNIPYTRMINEVIAKKEFRGTPEEHKLQLQADLSLGRTNAEELIRTALLNAPWSNLKEEPAIRFIEENGKGYYFEITLYSVKMKNMKFIEMALDKIPSLNIVSQNQFNNPSIL
jgi:Mechanosensitive ion channel, beta-domain